MRVKAKKKLGQHFLKDEKMAQKIVDALSGNGYRTVIEIGPGMGVLSQFLFMKAGFDIKLVEIDREAVTYLNDKFPFKQDKIISADFLQLDLDKLSDGPFAIIGNFPYNISSQILFKALEYKNRIPEIVGMFQKEVGVRIASPPGNREYGILSVLMQAFYEVELLYLLDETDFAPAPKVKSAVLKFTARKNQELGCDEKSFFRIVKMGFNQRRKTLKNALSQLLGNVQLSNISYLDKRAEALSWEQYVQLTNELSSTTNLQGDPAK